MVPSSRREHTQYTSSKVQTKTNIYMANNKCLSCERIEPATASATAKAVTAALTRRRYI